MHGRRATGIAYRYQAPPGTVQNLSTSAALAWGRDTIRAGSTTTALANNSLLEADPLSGCTPLHLALARKRWAAAAEILRDPHPVAQRWLASLAQAGLVAEDAAGRWIHRSQDPVQQARVIAIGAVLVALRLCVSDLPPSFAHTLNNTDGMRQPTDEDQEERVELLAAIADGSAEASLPLRVSSQAMQCIPIIRRLIDPF